MIGVAVIGYGYWGPNIVRNFQSARHGSVKLICDVNPSSLQRARRDFPEIETTQSCGDVMKAGNIDAVAIITPVATHFPLAKCALESGKHIFVEKPFTQTAEQACELINLANRKNLRIMVDHTFLFTGVVKKIKELIDAHVLGDLYYYDSTRVNLGLFQCDVNVIWDLAPHDFSIVQHLIPHPPQAVVVTGEKHVNGVEDVAYITVYYPQNLIAHFNVNWLSPVKIRTTLIGGQHKMLVWNDLEADEKIKVYDKGVHKTNGEGLYDLLVNYRMGDIWAPRVEQAEALKQETNYFFECVETGSDPFNDGAAGLQVVKMLEATNRSLANKGEMVYL